MKFYIDPAKVDYWKSMRGIDSDAELAEKAGVNKNSLTNVRQKTVWKSSTAIKLALALDCSPLDIITVEQAPEPFSLAPAAG